MKKSFFGATALCIITMATYAQTTISLKPDGVIGEDAQIWRLSSNCVPSGYPLTPADLNFGNDSELSFSAWTWSEISCADGTTRSLIRFTWLSTIPPGSTIINAKLVLHTPSSTMQWGNNLFPSTPLPLNNEGWVQRVLPGAGNPLSPNNWNEQTVTWNNQPATDPTPGNWVNIPITNSRWNWNIALDVTNMVQQIVSEMVTDPYANNGFLLRLITESPYYRQQVYASSDHEDCNMWPELIVTYRSRESAKSSGEDVQQSKIFTSDDPTSFSFISKTKTLESRNNFNRDGITVTPNPANTGWSISLSAPQNVEVTINLYNISGKLLMSSMKKLQRGSNQIYQSCQNISSGVYFIEIVGAGINKKEKVIKE